MNIIPHDKLLQEIFVSVDEPIELATQDIERKYDSIMKLDKKEIYSIFNDIKISPVVLNFIHSTTTLSSPLGEISTMIKSVFGVEIINGSYSQKVKDLFESINRFIHNVDRV